MGALDHKDLQELGLLYRQTASDLAIAREDITSSQLAAYLNSLLGRAHNLIYMGNKPKFGITVETEHDKYIIPGEKSRIGHYEYYADATQSSYPRNFFTEIICSQEEEVSDELFAA